MKTPEAIRAAIEHNRRKVSGLARTQVKTGAVYPALTSASSTADSLAWVLEPGENDQEYQVANMHTQTWRTEGGWSHRIQEGKRFTLEEALAFCYEDQDKLLVMLPVHPKPEIDEVIE